MGMYGLTCTFTIPEGQAFGAGSIILHAYFKHNKIGVFRSSVYFAYLHTSLNLYDIVHLTFYMHISNIKLTDSRTEAG